MFKYDLCCTASSNHPPCFVSWTHHSRINQLVQGFEISWPNHRTWEILITVYMKLWLWLQTLYLPALTSVILYSGFEMALDFLLKSGDEVSLFVLGAEIIYFWNAFCLKQYWQTVFIMATIVYGSNWMGNTFGLVFQILKNTLQCLLACYTSLQNEYRCLKEREIRIGGMASS